MRIGQMNPQSDLKLWDKSSKVRQGVSQPHERERTGGVGEARRSAVGEVSRRRIRRATIARGGSTSCT